MSLSEYAVFILRGMNLERIVATAAAAFDERAQAMIDGAADIVRDHGGTEDEVESFCDLQRQRFERDRDEQLAKLRAWLQRGCEYLN